jgi:hypothetical protein
LVNESKKTITADVAISVTNPPGLDSIALICDKGYTFESWGWTSAARRSAFIEALAGEDLCVQVDITAPTNSVSSVRNVWHYEGKDRSVADGFRAIYDDPKTLAPDVTLSLPRAAAIPAHKLVLIARSPVFRAMLTGPMKESTRRTIKIAHYEEDVVRAFLRFLYCDCCTAADLEAHALGLLAMADEYDVPALLSVCEAYLSIHLTEQNMVHVVEAADMHHLPTLKRTALEYVARHAEVFTRKSAYFGEGVPDFMKDITRALVRSRRGLK